MKTYRYLIFISLLINISCEKPDAKYEQEWQKLNANETKVILTLDGDAFYKPDEVFSGHIEIKDNYFVMNIFSNYESNLILNFSQENWLKADKIPGRLYNSTASTLMFGKVINKAENKGAGYLLYEGQVKPKTVTKSKIIFEITGTAKKYPKLAEEDESYPLHAVIIAKDPKIDVLEAEIPN